MIPDHPCARLVLSSRSSPIDFGTPAVTPADRLVSLTDPPSRDDQSDRAAVETLRNGGSVYALPAARRPSGSPVAATFRY